MRIAVLDLGSNSFHLLVAHAAPDGTLSPLDRRKKQVRLGEGSLLTGAITPDRWAKGLQAAADLGRRVRRYADATAVAVATAAIREAKNGASFLDAAKRAIGFRVELLTGEEEARLVYRGARAGLDFDPGRLAVIDLGGGSTEVVVGEGERCLAAWSLPVGALRMKGMFADSRTGVIDDEGAASLRQHVGAIAKDVARQVTKLDPDTFVLTSGTARAMRRMADELGLGGDFKHRIGLRAAESVARKLTGLEPGEIYDLGAPRKRCDTLAPGALSLCTLLGAFGATGAFVSKSALREGVALREWEKVHGPSRARVPVTV